MNLDYCGKSLQNFMQKFKSHNFYLKFKLKFHRLLGFVTDLLIVNIDGWIEFNILMPTLLPTCKMFIKNNLHFEIKFFSNCLTPSKATLVHIVCIVLGYIRKPRSHLVTEALNNSLFLAIRNSFQPH